MASSLLRFLDHTQQGTTVGRTPLDEWSACCKDLYLRTHNTHNRQTSMPSVGFDPTISTGERPQTYALRCPYTYESGSRVRLGSGSNESNSSVCGVSLMRVWWNISEPGFRVKLVRVWSVTHACVVKYIRAWLPSQAPRGGRWVRDSALWEKVMPIILDQIRHSVFLCIRHQEFDVYRTV
jgi:hypothetical protein